MAPQKSTDVREKEDHVRKRRAHQKSRRGCRNCKLRKVKCDETRPKCHKCISFGVNCNYDAKASDLQPSYDMQVILTTESSIPTPPSPVISRTLQPIVVSGDDTSSFELDLESLSRLDRFKNRTLDTIGTTATAQMFAQVTFDLVFAHPYLMHVVQVLTCCHDRHLSSNPLSKQSLLETYHITRAAALFNQKLSRPIQQQDKDALWATAALLGLLAYALTDVTTPEESWPLVVPTDSDPLEWLQIAESKSAVWNLVNPLRAESIFAGLSNHYQNVIPPFKIPLSGKEGIPDQFAELFEIDHWVTAMVNPYFTLVHILISLLPIPCDRGSKVRFLTFMGHMSDEFKDLLRARDPRALLLVAYYYAKVWKSTWWMQRRAVMECEAICLYLERNHADDKLLQEMLMVPKRRCGLVKEVQWIGTEELFLVRAGTEPVESSPLLRLILDNDGEPKDRLHWAVVPTEGR